MSSRGSRLSDKCSLRPVGSVSDLRQKLFLCSSKVAGAVGLSSGPLCPSVPPLSPSAPLCALHSLCDPLSPHAPLHPSVSCPRGSSCDFFHRTACHHWTHSQRKPLTPLWGICCASSLSLPPLLWSVMFRFLAAANHKGLTWDNFKYFLLSRGQASDFPSPLG